MLFCLFQISMIVSFQIFQINLNPKYEIFDIFFTSTSNYSFCLSCSRGNMAERAIKIVEFRPSQKPILDLNAIRGIVNSRGTHNLPTVVVSIGGVARSGKSFLLNLIVHFLRHIEKVCVNIVHNLALKPVLTRFVGG